MKTSLRCSNALAFFAILLVSTPSALAKPYPRDIPFGEIANNLVEKRCNNPCGWSGQLCCTASQQCITDSAGQAQCGTGSGSVGTAGSVGSGGFGAGANAQAGADSGHWQYYTTTIVQTDLVTRISTYSSYMGSAAATVAALPPATTYGGLQCNIPCGSICCASGQFCATAGQCQASGGGGGGVSSAAYSSYFAPVTTYSAPLRPTSGTVTISTSTQSATTTVPFQTPVGTAGGIVYGTGQKTPNKGLSGGAIAGIVIGVLLGIALILLLCCVASIRGLIGGGKKKTRKETTYVHESHHSHGGSGPAPGRPSWFGQFTGGTRPSKPPPKKSSNVGPIVAGLGALALALGLKRQHDRKKQRSEYGSESSYDSYYDSGTSDSKFDRSSSGIF